MSRFGQNNGLLLFIQDLFEEGSTHLVQLEPEDFHKIDRVMKRFKLDFDDAYQYTAAT